MVSMWCFIYMGCGGVGLTSGLVGVDDAWLMKVSELDQHGTSYICPTLYVLPMI